MIKSTVEYRTWYAMIRRCTVPSSQAFKDYGGRGIQVCERWEVFENFLADMGLKPSPQHSLDRYPDMNGNYKPGNCRWATSSQQNRNTRATPMIEYEGETLCVADWADRKGLPAHTVRARLHQGLPLDRVFAALAYGKRGGEKRAPTNPEKQAWRTMVYRCTNPDHQAYPMYGGRGITVCPEWVNDFAAFLSTVGFKPSPKHQLGRRDTSLGYTPENTKWMTREEQMGVTASSRVISHEDESLNLTGWAERMGIPYETVRNRLRAGWTQSQALGFEPAPATGKPGRPPKILRSK